MEDEFGVWVEMGSPGKGQGVHGESREMESWGRSQDHLDRMDIEWFWFLLSRGPIFPFCNGG